MQNILISGGTGMIGQSLTKALLQKGYRVTILTRDMGKKTRNAPYVDHAEWDLEKQQIDDKAIREADHVIHLAGAGVFDKRWTAARKREIVDSRVSGCHLLVKAMSEIPNRVRSVVSASAIGWYGPSSNQIPFKEEQPAAMDFLGRTCEQWESSIKPVEELGKRLVILRTGIVMSRSGGALKEFEMPLKMGIATILGSGDQVVSWIHINDLVNLYLRGIEQENMNGIYNAVAPNPVTNRTMVKSIARARNGNKFISVQVPTIILKTVLGEKNIEILKSAIVSGEKIQRAGFQFSFPTIETAMQDLFRK
jgi:uncharacterized protein (TIGR01777 family)